MIVVASVADPAVTAMAHGRGDSYAVYGAAAAERAFLDRAAAHGRADPGRGRRRRRRPRPTCPRAWPTATWRSKPPASSDPAPALLPHPASP